MNDSTPEIPADLPDADPSATAAAPKKAAVKRAPRKKKVEPAQAVEVQDAVDVRLLDVAEAPTLAGELPHGLGQQDVPVAPVVAHEPAIPETEREAGASDATPEPRHGERPNRGDGRARQPRLDGAGRDKRKVGAPAVQGYQFEDVVSGRFDEDDASAEMVPAKRVLLPQVETPKLHKVLAQAGLGSRLEMEQLILEGRISVNNEPAHIGQRIQFGDQVKVNGKPIRYRIDPPPARVIAYHKPVGEVVTHDDPQNRPTVFRKLPRLMQGKWQSVGRLDLNTEGLLLFTSSGELANKLMHPRFGLEREYAVRVLGALSNEEKQKLLDGVRLDDGMASCGSIEDGGGEGSNFW
jgi:23S rRNA pseudouridine2605 synthase